MKNKYIKLIFSFCVSLILCYYCYHQLTTSNSYVATNTPISQKIDTSDTLKTKVLVDSAIVLPQTQKIIKKKGFSVRLGKAKIAGNISNSINKDSLRILGLNENESYGLRSDMVNVTGDYFSYRMNPDGTQFSENIFIELPYDLSKIPIGYTVNDVRTYYYDVAYKSWIEINFDSVNFRDQTIVSRVNHFTDFMNAIIKQPEMPETSAFVPTKLADMKPADPLSGFSLIGIPEANNSGSASVNYPLNIPKGRNGLQPQLNLAYQNGTGSSWLGQDWNLSIPCISIETRWGVPLYDKKYQSETYLLNGQPLITKTGDEFDPLTYRDDFKKRETGVVQFYPRVESAFNQIFRHGDSPYTYWWEVIDKSGVHFYYGKSHSAEKADPNFVLDAPRMPAPREDENGNIGKWMLSEIQDLSGNRVLYYYDKCNYRSGDRYILPQKIVYTCYKQDTIADDHYQIQFKRKSRKQLKMLDRSFNCRLGFKEVVNDLLTDVVITYKSNIYRHYHLEYSKGEFGKTLLKKLSVLNPENLNQSITIFDLEYYEKPKKMFSDPEKIGKGSISSSRSNSLSDSGTLGFGLGTDFAKQTSTLNGTIGIGKGCSNSKTTLIDITGDGYPDRVSKVFNSLWVEELSHNGTTPYFKSKEVIDIPINDFLVSRSKSESYGGQIQVGEYFNASYNNSQSKTSTSVYFSDVDANGLIDIVDNGKVYYNKGLINGTVKFELNNSDTLYIGGSCKEFISRGVEVSDSLYDESYVPPSYYYTDNGEWGVVYQSHIDSTMNAMPNFETVRMWIAPFDGSVSINNTISLEKKASDQSSKCHVTDGVKCWVQHNMSDLVNLGTVSKTDTLSQQLTYDVVKGDKIYFRTQSLQSRLFDKVLWNPIITYTSTAYGNDVNQIDAEGLSAFQFNAKEEFFVNSMNKIKTPFEGNVILESNITISEPLSAPIHLRLKHNGYPKSNYDIIIPQKTTVDNEKYSLPPISVNKDDKIELELYSEGNVKWNAIKMKSELYYVSMTSNPSFEPMDTTSDKNNPTHTLFYDMSPVVTQYPNTVIPSKKHTIDKTDYYQLTMDAKYNQPVNRFGDLKLVIKSQENGLEKTYNVSEITNFMVTQELCSCKYYYFDLYSDDREFLKSLDEFNIVFNGNKYQCGVHTTYEDSLIIYGPLYRSWGQFIYINHGDSLMDETKLQSDGSVVDRLDSVNMVIDSTNINTIPSQIDSIAGNNAFKNGCFSQMVADQELNIWKSIGGLCYLSADTMSHIMHPSTYHKYGVQSDTVDVIDLPTPYIKGNWYINAPCKQSSCSSNSVSLGVSIGGGVSVGACSSEGNSYVTSDFMDLNGDGYPDAITGTKTQFSKPQGGLSSLMCGNIPDRQGYSKTYNTSDGESLGKTFPIVKRVVPINDIKREKTFSLGGNLSHTRSTNTGKYSLFDINGDGLPDKIQCNENSTAFFINHGYGFYSKEEINTVLDYDVKKSSNTGLGIPGIASIMDKLGEVGLWAGSISFGLNGGYSSNSTISQFVDINGDNLPDLLKENSVRYNMGLNYSEDCDIPSLKMPSGFLLACSRGVTVTAGVPICLFTWCFKITYSGGFGTFSNDFSFDPSTFIDINADGFTDIVSSDGDVWLLGALQRLILDESDRTLYVRKNLGYKTNLLKKVKNVAAGSYTIDYKQFNASNKDPHTRTVMSSVVVSDMDTVPNNSKYKKNQYHYSYEYSNPKYNRVERDFYGFEEVITSQDNQNGDHLKYTINQYLNDNFKTARLLLKSQNYFDKSLLSETLYEYKMKQISDGQIVPDSIAFCYSDTYPALNKKTVIDYENHGKITTVEEYSHTSFGNIDKITNFGNIERKDDDVEIITKFLPKQSNNLTGLISEVAVYHGTQLLRKSNMTWNTSKGYMTSFSKSINDKVSARTEYSYDQYGNINTLILPPNANNERPEYHYTYETDHHSNVSKIVDSFGLQVKIEYDPTFQNPIMSYDTNDKFLKFDYDILGRLINVNKPNSDAQDDFAFHYYYALEFDYPPCEFRIPIWATTQRHTEFDQKPPSQYGVFTIIAMDGIGRTIQKYETWSNDLKQTRVTESVEYDELGRVVKKYNPFIYYYSINCHNIHLRMSSLDFKWRANYTEMIYDGKNRVIKTILPNKDEIQTRYDVNGKDGYFVESIEGNGNSSYQLKNVLGQVECIVNGEKGVTYFTYLPTGELMESVDPEKLVTQYRYDLLGHVIERKHPDANKDFYEYDQLGNVISYTNSRFESLNIEGISYIYKYNRLTEVVDHYMPINSIKYYYGGINEFSESKNAVGRILAIEDATGFKEFMYGNLGEKIEEKISMVLPNDKDPISFTFHYEYDFLGRMRKMYYPDGDEIEYAYDANGLMSQVIYEGAEIKYKYNEFGKRTDVLYPNGISTFYQYDDNARLIQLSTRNRNYELLQNIEYDFDKNNNIVKVENKSDIINGYMGGAYEKSYQYDGRNWLIEATGNNKVNKMNYSQSMKYMGDGRMLQKQTNCNSMYNNDNDYTYFPGTHKIKSITDNQQGITTGYDWDLSGNLICMFGGEISRKQVWNSTNRLTFVYDGITNHISYYGYDYAGNRSYKVFVDQECRMDSFVLYPSPFLVMTEKGYTNHYYASNELLFSRLGHGGLHGMNDKNDVHFDVAKKYDETSSQFLQMVNEYRPDFGLKDCILYQIRHFEQVVSDKVAIYYCHKDHLGSSAWITDQDGEAIQYLDYLPWGEKYIDQGKDYSSRYTFSGKELDKETGYQYFGARYNDPERLGWMSVDPLSDKYPMFSPYVYCANNPIILVDLNGEEPTPGEAARIAAHVYGDKTDDILTGGWQVSSQTFKLENNQLNNSDTGLKSAIYERRVDGQVTEYVYAMAGTGPNWNDVGADVKQLAGLSNQYNDAVENAGIILENTTSELSFVGHSLGGGEAALCALVTGKKAITFNAAGVSPITQLLNGGKFTFFGPAKNIDAYIMFTDPLNYGQNCSLRLPNVDGKQHFLIPPDFSSWINGHSINNILKKFGVHNPNKYDK